MTLRSESALSGPEFTAGHCYCILGCFGFRYSHLQSFTGTVSFHLTATITELNISGEVIPEPSALMLLSGGLILFVYRRCGSCVKLG
ncbi:MAG: PEP-CTERM sorting domain-containing protein [Chthoniobacterales bacterium]